MINAIANDCTLWRTVQVSGDRKNDTLYARVLFTNAQPAAGRYYSSKFAKLDHAAALSFARGWYGATDSSTVICSSVSPAIELCFQPVHLNIWIASERDGSRIPFRISEP